MKTGMTLEALLAEVQRQSRAKQDFVASTEEAIRMVPMPGFPREVALVLLGADDQALRRFRISDHCHHQIAGRLQIPWKYYDRLLTDHRDLVMDQVNALFEREPARRLLRTMDGIARGFLSDRYLRIDNDAILTNTLPPIIRGDIETKLLSSHVSDQGGMSLKLLMTDDSLAVDLGRTARGDAQDIVRPGFRMSNDEVGRGKTKIEGFFYRSYCLNGCVFGTESTFDFSRTHLGGKILDGIDYEVLSDETRRLEDQTIVAQIRDVMTAIGDKAFHVKLGERLLATKQSEHIAKPTDAIRFLAKEVNLTDSETDQALTNLLTDADLTQWGAVNAVTKIANSDETTYERANELESIGAKILALNPASWNRIAEYVEAA